MIPFPDKHYRVIYADPPWHFRCGIGKGSRHPSKHYKTMTLGHIACLPVGRLAHPEGARLFCWATAPMLPQALWVIETWGFKYSTCRFWVKTSPKRAAPPWSDHSFPMGTGYEVRGNPEVLIIAKTGRPEAGVKVPRALVISPRREHSRKPYIIRHEIFCNYQGPRIELFARDRTPGWDVWGDEVMDIEANSH